MVSIIGRAKRSVDNTVDAYMGRVAFALSVLGALGFALVGVWIVIADRFGTTVACFALAAIFVLLSLIIHATVEASERAAERDLKVVERSMEKNGLVGSGLMPFDVSTLITVLPLLAPLVRSLRTVLPYLIVAGLLMGYLVATAKPNEEQAPET